jgi:2-dehydro-3-deoxygalactonokinase
MLPLQFQGFNLSTTQPIPYQPAATSDLAATPDPAATPGPPAFLSCDWGTSSLRIRWVDLYRQRVLAEKRSGKGIRETYLLWNKTGGDDPVKRISFYTSILRECIAQIEEECQVSLAGVPVLLSGMASSSAGMMELDYAPLPFALDGVQLFSQWLDARDDFAHPVLLVSGIRSGDDVMRGEETQLIGCLGGVGVRVNPGRSGLDGLYIFPGTHSKHILVRDNTLIGFSTYMTGEFFELLSEKSLLSGSVEKNKGMEDARHLESFQRGVKDAVGANLLHAAFRVRTNTLLKGRSKKENFHYLSGLLIGTELQALGNSQVGDADSQADGESHGAEEENHGANGGKIYLCCGAELLDYYEKALAVLDLCERVHIFPADWVDMAVVRGHCQFLLP